MASYIECFKGYQIKNLMDYSGNYEIVMVDNDNSGDYISSSLIDKIGEYLKKYDLSNKWRELIPIITEITDAMTKDEVECLKSRLVDPTICIEFIIKNNINKKIKIDKPNEYEEMLETLENIANKWNQGYYIIEWW